MITQPTPESFNKLPKWARDHIETLTRQLSNSQAQCERFAIDQKESPFYVDEWLSTPSIKRYIDATHCRLCCDYAGVHLEVLLPTKDDNQRYYGPEISYRQDGRLSCDIAIMTRGNGVLQLVAKENLR